MDDDDYKEIPLINIGPSELEGRELLSEPHVRKSLSEHAPQAKSGDPTLNEWSSYNPDTTINKRKPSKPPFMV